MPRYISHFIFPYVSSKTTTAALGSLRTNPYCTEVAIHLVAKDKILLASAKQLPFCILLLNCLCLLGIPMRWNSVQPFLCDEQSIDCSGYRLYAALLSVGVLSYKALFHLIYCTLVMSSREQETSRTER